MASEYPPKILLLGKNGQIGQELQRSLSPLGEVIACGRADINFEDSANLRSRLREIGPEIIVNAAAYTAVDKAESDAERAYQVNAEAVRVLADAAAHSGALLLHYSSEYVFDGEKKTSYTETDAPRPLSVYGASKLAGEEAIRGSGCDHLIFRTTWIFSPRGHNFAKTILRLAGERDHLQVVDDQVGAPTSAVLVAEVTAWCLRRVLESGQRAAAASLFGTYHLTASGKISRYGYAQYLIRRTLEKGAQSKLNADAIEPVSASDYAVPAKRPANSTLATDKICQAFDLSLPDWRVGVDQLLDEIL